LACDPQKLLTDAGDLGSGEKGAKQAPFPLTQSGV
jgi:hypothetical protein